MGERRTLLAVVRTPPDDSRAKGHVVNFFSSFEADQRNSVLRYSLTAKATEPISKFSNELCVVLTFKLDIRGRLEKARENLIRQWQLDYELSFQYPSRSEAPFHQIREVELSLANLMNHNTLRVKEKFLLTSSSLLLEHTTSQVTFFFNPDSLSFDPFFSKVCFQYRNVRRLIISVTDSEVTLCFQLLNGPSLWKSKVTARNLRETGDEPRDIFFQRASSLPTRGSALTMKDSEAFKTLVLKFSDDGTISFLYRLMHRVRQHGDVYFTRLTIPSKYLESGVDVTRVLSSLYKPEYFDALYPILACISYSAEFTDRLEYDVQTSSMIQLIDSHLGDAVTRRALKDAFEDILYSLENGDLIDLLKTVKYLIRKYTEKPKRIPVIPGTALVRRVIITPGRILYRPAELHASNRILRNYEAEYALTVSFRDHDFQKLSFSAVDMVPEVVGPVLRTGLKIFDRSYSMLAASSSQLRDHVVWMYAEDSRGRVADDIRDEMGNFSQISNVAKKMARMGQTLSSTTETVDIKDDEYEVVEDVSWPEAVHPRSRKPYCFSDGVGSISSELMKDVANCLGWQTNPPSAIQIRFKGCKGMLCLDPTLTGRKMRLRRSMEKFICTAPSAESSKWCLEVIKRSWPTPLYLNRQLIPLLEHHGIEMDILHQLQLNMVFTCAQSLVDQDEALKKLSAYVKRRLPFKNMSQSGWNLLTDPFCNNMLYHLFFESLKNVKERARIAIPLNCGRNMLGVMDETGKLEYGQVFVQYTSVELDDEGRALVVQGPVLMSKCPCVHPGDVRVLTAVDVPELRTLKDCVVFPSRGKRPHPQEMAGSDLDGDEYIVIWDQRFIFPGDNAEPFVYADVPARPPQDFTKWDEANFFVKYIQNDVIGIASSAHMALADKFDFTHAKCLNLVEKISAALDFAKTEEPVRISPDEKAEAYPDFMANGRMHSYRSEKVLGHLYRTIKDMVPRAKKPRKVGAVSSLEVPGWMKFLEKAVEARNSYESHLSAIMQQHGISTEAELFTGIISRHSRFNSMKHDKENAEIVIAKQCEHLLESTRKRFQEDVKDLIARYEPDDDEECLLLKRQLASAWFMTVYGEEDKERRFFSFPWSIASILAETLKWLKSQPSYKPVPIEKNILLQALKNKFSSDHYTLKMFMEEWLGTDGEGSPLNKCSCFSRIISTYELEVAANELPIAEKILLFVKKIIYGEFTQPDRICAQHCRNLLKARGRSVPRVSIIISRLYLRMCLNRGPDIENIPDEEEEPYDEASHTFNIQTPQFREMLQNDRPHFETTIRRFKSWTGIENMKIRVRNSRNRRPHSRQRSGQVIFEFSGTQYQVNEVTAILFDDYFEGAFLSNDQSLLHLRY